ncbi:MAG: TonB-dependent receptor [Alphaproteobacteria bacterium]|nr:TonB-dependent receptor [Alphaproteobacteria bacterium]
MIPLLLALCAPAHADGTLQGFVFEEGSGLPLSGQTLEIAGQPVRTDADGGFSVTLPQGEHPVRLRDYSAALTVADGEVTELLLTVGPSGVTALVEAPALRSGPVAAGPPGTLHGRILHAEEGTPIVGARVFVRGEEVEGRSDADGVFELELPSGTHELSIVRSGFSTMAVPDVVVEADTVSELRVELLPAGLEMADYTIKAPRVEGGSAELLAQQRDASAVTNVMGAEDMAKSGASDAAAALSRVTGITVVGGKYVYVRGLGERYSATLLNGSSLPSPEPERRVVPLDLFPASALESITVQKSYTPDMPGEFGGGVLQLKTRSAPPQLTASVSVGGEWVQGVTFQEGPLGYVGDRDWMGFDDGGRDLPAPIANADPAKALRPGGIFDDDAYTEEELETFGESFPNRWFLDTKDIPPAWSGKLSVGGSKELGRVRVGGLLGSAYSNAWDYDRYTFNAYGRNGDALTINQQYAWEETSNKIRAGLIGTASVGVGEDHLITLTSVTTRISDHTSRTLEGDYDNSYIKVARDQWVERQLLFEQVSGAHTLAPLGDLHVDWRYAFSNAARDEPLRREWRVDRELDGTWLLSDRPEGNEIFYSDLTDVNHDLGLDLTKPFTLKSDETLRVKAGGWVVRKTRESGTRRFKYQENGASEALRAEDPDQWFTKETIGQEFRLRESTNQSDDYFADQSIIAGYLMGDVPVGPSVRLVGGVRMEYSAQSVTTYELYVAEAEPAVASLDTVDWLPALNATWAFAPDMQLRAGYGKTLSRPDFRELSEVPYAQVTGGRTVKGNSDLDRTRIHNVDLRWEWYPNPGESLSFATFYKYFVGPIEQIVQNGAEEVVTYQNVDFAHDLGAEVEWKKAMPALGGKLWLQDFYTAGNMTFIWSRVDDPRGEEYPARALQGQAPWVGNVQLGYDNPEIGTQVTLLLNLLGPRAIEISDLTRPGDPVSLDPIQYASPGLDLIYRQKLPKGFNLTFKARNLLNPRMGTFQRGPLDDYAKTDGLYDGIKLGLSVGWGV